MTDYGVLEGNLKKGLLKMAIPLFFLNLLNSLYGVVDTYFVGKIGELAVGAISLVQPIMWCAISVAMGLSAGCIAIVSNYVGAKDKDNANRFATEIIYFCVFFAILLIIGTYLLCKPILAYLNTPSELYNNAYLYLRMIAFDYIGLFFINIYMAINQAYGNSRSGVILSAVASIINVVLDPIFIFVLHMGVQGAALATVLSKLLVLPVLLSSLMNTKKTVYVSFKTYSFKIKDAIHIMKLSIPSACGQFLEALGFVIMNKYIVFYGAAAISAYGVGERLTNLYNIPIIALSSVLPTFIGQNLGAGNIQRAKRSYFETMLISTIACLLLLAFGMAFVRPSILLFVPDASNELLSIATEFIFFSLVMGVFVTWYFDLCGVFNGAGHTNISFILSISRLWVLRIPLIVLFFNYTDFGIRGIWYAMLISNFIAGLIGQILYWIYPWTVSKVMKE